MIYVLQTFKLRDIVLIAVNPIRFLGKNNILLNYYIISFQTKNIVQQIGFKSQPFAQALFLSYKVNSEPNSTAMNPLIRYWNVTVEWKLQVELFKPAGAASNNNNNNKSVT